MVSFLFQEWGTPDSAGSHNRGQPVFPLAQCYSQQALQGTLAIDNLIQASAPERAARLIDQEAQAQRWEATSPRPHS